MTKNRFLSINFLILVGTVLGVITGLSHIPFLFHAADSISKIIVNLLSLISIPMIFLSIVSTISGMQNMDEIKLLGKEVLKYTILTTIIAASIGLILFIIINPAQSGIGLRGLIESAGEGEGYLSVVLSMFPSNVVKTFNDGNVMGVVFIALGLSLSILTLPTKNKDILHDIFSSLFAAILKITTVIIYLMPVAVWAFISIFIHNLAGQDWNNINSLFWYVITVLLANVIQGLIVLPLFLLFKGISPIRAFKGMSQALTVAFFSRSSGAALPITMQNAQQNLGVSERVSKFTLPLCSTINMNACAAFILITVLFIGTINGVYFSWIDMIMWIFIATIAAIGNAGVPMGCYFLSSALLVAMKIPINILVVILPLYAFIDMVETALNVWSDSVVALVVDKELKAK
ncbi:dicarboxylate/amino acid:cation symporter [bacterium]|jgi:Na+/H+-dicarboxylate symporter|nr:dicarboxylate/amino acid:cation symporter [bacterium]MBT5015562.1 dicarboxylate/amino acid:cation symporter [bacterium]